MNDALAARVAELGAARGNSQTAIDGSTQAASGGGGPTNQPLADGGRPQGGPSESATDDVRSRSASFAEESAGGVAPTANGGGEAEVVALSWQHEASEGILALEHMLYVFRDDERPTVRHRMEKLRRLVEVCRDHIVPLYRQPPQPRGWLTEEEREALTTVLFEAKRTYHKKYDGVIKAVKSLLARSTSPEVVRPERWTDMRVVIGNQRDAQWIAAIAAAGVAVKEVGSE
jgi:hypothetical protein